MECNDIMFENKQGVALLLFLAQGTVQLNPFQVLLAVHLIWDFVWKRTTSSQTLISQFSKCYPICQMPRALRNFT